MRINLKDFRQSHGLFQSEMAAILGMNQSNISRAELKGFLDISYPQQKILNEKYGKEDVEKFIIRDDGPISVSASNNKNEGDVTQNNRFFASDIKSLEIIKQQSEALAELAAKQSQQTDRILDLLEKLSEKL